MSTTKKPTGIIYRAYNTISGKSYVGQTTRTLQARKRRHLIDSKKYDFKFPRALQKYPESSWEWSILAEVDIEKLDEYERFFIDDLDSINSGYNCYYPKVMSKKRDFDFKNKSATISTKIYDVYHPEFGHLSGTKKDLEKIEPAFSNVSKLLLDTTHIKGWILAENIEKYDEIKNPPQTPITLSHKKFGTHTLFRKEFIDQFGLTKYGISKLVKGNLKTSYGWTLVEES